MSMVGGGLVGGLYGSDLHSSHAVLIYSSIYCWKAPRLIRADGGRGVFRCCIVLGEVFYFKKTGYDQIGYISFQDKGHIKGNKAVLGVALQQGTRTAQVV